MKIFCFLASAVFAGAFFLAPAGLAKDAESGSPGPVQHLGSSGSPAHDEQAVQQLAQSKQIKRAPRMQLDKYKRAPTTRQKLFLEGNKLRAAPGYVLEATPDNQVSARRIGGGRSGVKVNCRCFGSHGLCEWSASDDVAVCSKAAGDPCSGKCRWSSNVAAPTGGMLQKQ